MTTTPFDRPVKLPALPEMSYLGDDRSYGYEAYDMQDYARDAIIADRAAASLSPASVGAEGWMPIASAPKDGTVILLSTDSRNVAAGFWDGLLSPRYPWRFLEDRRPGQIEPDSDDDEDLVRLNAYRPDAPTHWMPLPPAPGTAASTPSPAAAVGGGGEASKDAERLDWLLSRLPGDALRHCVGELADTADGSEFRHAIDAARAAQQGAEHGK